MNQTARREQTASHLATPPSSKKSKLHTSTPPHNTNSIRVALFEFHRQSSNAKDSNYTIGRAQTEARERIDSSRSERVREREREGEREGESFDTTTAAFTSAVHKETARIPCDRRRAREFSSFSLSMPSWKRGSPMRFTSFIELIKQCREHGGVDMYTSEEERRVGWLSFGDLVVKYL